MDVITLSKKSRIGRIRLRNILKAKCFDITEYDIVNLYAVFNRTSPIDANQLPIKFPPPVPMGYGTVFTILDTNEIYIWTKSHWIRALIFLNSK
jgi:hypothetical protein